MKEKLEQLRNAIKAALDAAEKLIGEGKFDEAKAKQDEAKALRTQAEVVKAQIAEADQSAQDAKDAELASIKAKNAKLEADAKKPVTLPFDEVEGDGEDGNKKSEVINPIVALRYTEPDAAVKAVLGDLYGSATNYNQRRHDQMAVFSKYVRFGDRALRANEVSLLVASAKNLLVHPDVLKAEIVAGRTLAEIKATLEEGSNELGGYLVPEDFRMSVITRLMGMTVVRARAMKITTARDAVEFPRLEGGNSRFPSAVRVTWVDETPASSTVSETNPTFGSVRIPVHTVMARTNLSLNLLEDSAVNLIEFLSDQFAIAMAIDEDENFLIGTGGGRPFGVLGDRATGNDEAPVTGVGVANSGNATQITADGLIDLVYTVDSQYRQTAVVVMAKNTQRDVRKLKDGESRYLWQPGLVSGQPATLLGYPVAESEAMPAIGANKHPLIFGDFMRGYLIVDRVGMSIRRVEDTTTAGQNQVALFARRRLGGQTVAPWAFAAQKISA